MLLAEEHDRPIRGNQPEQRQPQRGLAGAGFADDAERLALADRDADAVHRLDMADGRAQQPALDRKPDLQIVGRHHHRLVGPRRRRIGLRLGRQQRARIGMLRRGEDFLDRPLLDDLARVHHADDVGDAADDAEIVGDEQHAHAEPRPDLGEQRQDLGLHRDVERGGRLVRDQQIRLVGERHRDHDALALAAGQLMRIALQPGFGIGNADLRQQLERARPRHLPADAAVQEKNLADLRLDRVQRIERGHRLLEDDRDVVAADLAHLAFRRRQQLAAAEADAGRRDARRWDTAAASGSTTR